LIKTGEPASFGITVELLMLASAAAIVGGLFIGTQSTGAARRRRKSARGRRWCWSCSPSSRSWRRCLAVP
jgi:hypothetical protein